MAHVMLVAVFMAAACAGKTAAMAAKAVRDEKDGILPAFVRGLRASGELSISFSTHDCGKKNK